MRWTRSSRAARISRLEQWRGLLLRSVGFEPARFTARQQDVLLARMVPFVVTNYNAVELGPRGTGKSHLFQQISPYAHLVSGGKATIANMFVNNRTGRRGLVAQYDVICFDEVSGVSFDTKEGVNILKGYMESGEFSRGKESIRAEGGIVMVGNFDVDVYEQLRQGHLFGPMPKEMRDDTAFHDRIHAYLPGWDVPKLDPSYFTDHFGFVSDFLAECWSQLRRVSRLDVTQGRSTGAAQLSGRDRRAANNTVNGLLKLLWPDPEMEVPDEALAWAAELALELRRRVKEQQAFIGAEEFGERRSELSRRRRTRRRSSTARVGAARGGETSELRRRRRGTARSSRARTRRGHIDNDANGARRTRRRHHRRAIRGSSRSSARAGSRAYTESKTRSKVKSEPSSSSTTPPATTRFAERSARCGRSSTRMSFRSIWAGKTSDGDWYLITEYIEGESLEEYVNGERQLRDREAVDVALDILDALVAIHPNAERLAELDAQADKTEGFPRRSSASGKRFRRRGSSTETSSP